MARHIAILGTGGTIAGLSEGFAGGYQAAQKGVQSLLAEALCGDDNEVSWQAEQVAQLDSKDMTAEVWAQLAIRCRQLLLDDEVEGIVITHGTDTLEETAWFLASVLDAHKPVVLTCAMRPWDDPQPDGPQNLRDALLLAADATAHGVLVSVQGEAFAAVDVIKLYVRRDAAFVSDSAQAIACKQQGVWVLNSAWPQAKGPYAEAVHQGVLALEKLGAQWPWVEVVYSRGAVDARGLQVLLQGGVQGIVVAATGIGTVHAQWLGPLQSAHAQGLPVVVAGRCAMEPLDTWAAEGLTLSAARSPAKACISVALELLCDRSAAAEMPSAPHFC